MENNNFSETCGNGEIEAGESCDGANLGGQTCELLGYPGGDLACTTQCGYDTTGCDPLETCGNDAIDPPEACDGTQSDTT